MLNRHFRLTQYLRSGLLAWLCLSIAIPSHAALPDINSSSSKTFSLKEEQRIGRMIMQEIRRSGLLVEDPEVSQYIQQLGYRLVAHNEDAEGREFHFFVLSDTSINAAAWPGGYIGINAGLINLATQESELAAVMAHEIAHVTQRHIARFLEQGKQVSLSALAAILGSIIIASQNPEAGIAAISAAQAGAVQSMINFTRVHESEADRIAIPMLAGAGFNAKSAAMFFQKLLDTSRYDKQSLEFLRSHPLTEKRVAETRSLANAYATPASLDNQPFELFRTLVARRVSNEQEKDRQYYEQKIKEGVKTAAVSYGYALSLIDTGDYAKAELVLEDLLKQQPEQLSYIIAKANLLYKQQKYRDAQLWLQHALNNYPNQQALWMLYGRVLIDMGHAKQARNMLNKYLVDYPEEPALYQLLAEASSHAGFPAEVHEYQGYYYLLLGDLQSALTQFKLALNHPKRDVYAQSRLKVQIERVREAMRK